MCVHVYVHAVLVVVLVIVVATAFFLIKQIHMYDIQHLITHQFNRTSSSSTSSSGTSSSRSSSNNSRSTSSANFFCSTHTQVQTPTFNNVSF